MLAQSRRWFTQMGLTLNEQKTRVCEGRHEAFDFLGYTFGPLRSRKKGHRYVGAGPAKKAVKRVKGRIRQILRPGNQARVGRGEGGAQPRGARVGELLQLWHSGSGLPGGGSLCRRADAILSWAEASSPLARGAALLRGARLWGSGSPFAGASSRCAICACPGVRPVREPDVGKLQVRFDEEE